MNLGFGLRGLLAAGLFAAFSAAAQVPDPRTLIASLATERTGPIVRSIATSGAVSLSPSQPLPPGLDLPAADVAVGFEAKSHLLTVAGMTVLRSIALALNDPRLAGSDFQVAGHYVNMADPVGAQAVSSRRAAAVVEHLVAFYGVERHRLTAVGYGQSKPLYPADISSPLNSRIQFVNVDALEKK